MTCAVQLTLSGPTFILMRLSKVVAVGIAPSLKIMPWAARVLWDVLFPKELSLLSRWGDHLSHCLQVRQAPSITTNDQQHFNSVSIMSWSWLYPLYPFPNLTKRNLGTVLTGLGSGRKCGSPSGPGVLGRQWDHQSRWAFHGPPKADVRPLWTPSATLDMVLAR